MATTQAERWVKQAFKDARKRAGSGWHIIGTSLRYALAARELTVIFAAQDVANGDTMREAAELLLSTEEA
jgi:hypothetical protein